MELVVGTVLAVGIMLLMAGMTPADGLLWFSVRVKAACLVVNWAFRAFTACLRSRWPEAVEAAKVGCLRL